MDDRGPDREEIRHIEDAFVRLEPQFIGLSEDAIRLAPSARVHLLRCGAACALGAPFDPATELAAARTLDATAADRSLAQALDHVISGDRGVAAMALVEHCQEHDEDAVARVFRYSNLVMSGVQGDRERAHALNELDARRHRGDWRFDAELAMTRQEQRRYDEARALAEGVLSEEPTAGFGVHVLAHVNYETGEHSEGLAWLDSWQAGRPVLGYQNHFRWHAALHLLALGDVEQALARYRVEMTPDAVIDAGSLLWRCKLAGTSVEPEASEAVDAAAEVIETLPTPFLTFNACLALASANDREGLESVARRVSLDARPAFADLLAPVIHALLAMIQDRFEEAVTSLKTIMSDLPQLGGSNAQREVVEDTFICSLMASGSTKEARAIIQARLERRPHALDELSARGVR